MLANPQLATVRKKRHIVFLSPEEIQRREEEKRNSSRIAEYEKRKRWRNEDHKKRAGAIVTYAGANGTEQSIVPVSVPKKRRRCGGKAAGKFKTGKIRTTRRGDLAAPECDENGMPLYFITDQNAVMAAHEIALPLERIYLAYPELLPEVVRNLPSDFPTHFTLPSHSIIQNTVATFSLGNRNITFQKLVAENPSFQFNPSAFAAATMRATDPDCAALAFQSGSMVSAGTQSVNAACYAASNLLLLFTKLGVPCSFHDFVVENIVASSSIGFPVRLYELAVWTNRDKKYGTVRYEPNLFPGLTFRVKNSKIVFLVFLQGALVITGARFGAQISYMLTWFYYTVLVQFFCPELQKSSAEYRVVQSSKQVEDILRNMTVHNNEVDAVETVTGTALDENERDFLRKIVSETADEYDDRPLSFMVTEGLEDIIERRRAEALALADTSIKEFGNDFGILAFAQNNANLVWWDNHRIQKKRNDDLRWYTSTLADMTQTYISYPPETPMVVNVCKYLSLQVMRIRHMALTGHDKFDPVILNMLLDCSHDEVFRMKIGKPFAPEYDENLFVLRGDEPPPSKYWERDDDGVRANLANVFTRLRYTPGFHPQTWQDVAGDLPKFPVYKRHVCNMYNDARLKARQAQFRLYDDQTSGPDDKNNI